MNGRILERITQEQYEEIVNEFKRESGKMISSVYKMYGMDAFHPEVTNHITGLCEKAIDKVCKLLENN
jgi:tRNA U54 and U55 pseudouridine synthase Pus10